jgi:hypothetical protein
VPEVVIVPPPSKPVPVESATLVTEPLPVPAPIAVLNAEALKKLTVLSAFALRKVTAWIVTGKQV